MREEHPAGLECLEAAATLLQRIQVDFPRRGLYQAAEILFWWSTPRATDDLDQLVWYDETGAPCAAAFVADFGDGGSLLYDDPTLVVLVMPDAAPGWVAQVVERALDHIADRGIDRVGIEVDQTDHVMRDVLIGHGFRRSGDGLIECWMPVDARPEISPLHDGYRLVSRADVAGRPHHLSRSGRHDVEARLRQTSLYRSDLDLLVIDADDEHAAHALFWYDPVTETGVVEPVRTLDEHQQRGLSRHLLTAGLERLAHLGATHVSIGYEPDNRASGPLYRSLGFEPNLQTDLYAR